MTQISWQYQVNNRAGGYIVTNTDWNDIAADLRAFIDQTTASTTDNTPLPIGIDLVNDRVYISDPDSTTPEDGNHADTTLSVVGTTTLNGNTQQTGTFTVGVDDTGHDVKFFGATATNGYMLWDESTDDLVLGTASRLGIGIAAPTSSLHVSNTTNITPDGNSVGHIQISGSGYAGCFALDGDGFWMSQNSASRSLIFATDETERMRITGAGLVGIGIAAADNLLHVYEGNSQTSSHADAQVTIENDLTVGLQLLSGSGQENRIIFGDRYDNDIGGITYDHDDNSMRFVTNTLENMKIGQAAEGSLVTITNTTAWNSAEYVLEVNNIETANSYGNGVVIKAGNGHSANYPFFVKESDGTNLFYIRGDKLCYIYGNAIIDGSLTKGSGTFDIAHPTKGGDWRLRHSFIEGPQADLIYRGTVTLSGGTATVDLDTASNMTDGTWEALCRDPWAMVASSGNAVEWSLSGKTLTVTSDTADAVCSWMVIAERQDDHMKHESNIADDDGKVIVEYEVDPNLADPADVATVPEADDEAAEEAAA